MKIVEFLINEDDDTGVKTISLVDAPAMKSDFIAFDENKPKTIYVALADESGDYKQVVAGLSIIPDKLIYRLDEETGEEYSGYFSQETIEKIRTKYHKEMMTSNVNLDHNENEYIDAFLIESYLLSTEARVEEVTAQGIEGATLGAWYTQFKIEDEDVFQKVLDGEYNGLSIEAYLNKELTASLKNKFKEKEKKMKKSIVQKFKDFLVTLEAEDEQAVESTVKFEDALVPELDISITWGDVGAEVTKTFTNEDDEEVTEPVGQGEFVLEDGRIVVVDEDSMLIEVQDAPAEEEEESTEESTETTEEETAEVKAEEKTEETEVKAEAKAEEKTEETEVKAADEDAEEEAAEEEGMPDAVKTWITQIAGDFENGDIYISFMKTGGELTYGSVSTYANIKMTTELNEKIADLELKMAEPIAEPKLTDSTITSKDFKELSVYQRVAQRKGIQEV